MAKTFFKERWCWMYLKNYEEVQLLLGEIKTSIIKWKIQLIEETIHEKLGKRIIVAVEKPSYPGQSEYLYGPEYHEWEKIKRRIYTYRRKYK